MYSNRHSASKNDLERISSYSQTFIKHIHVFAFISTGMGDEKTCVVIWKTKRLKFECLQRLFMYLNVVGCHTANDVSSILLRTLV